MGAHGPNRIYKNEQFFVLVFLSTFCLISGIYGKGNTPAEKYLGEADKAMAQGRSSYAKAIELYTLALNAAGEDDAIRNRVLLKRADAYGLRHDYEKGIADLTHIIAVKPTKAALKMRAGYSAALGEFADATQDYVTLQHVDPAKQADYAKNFNKYGRLAAQKQHADHKLAEIASGRIGDAGQKRQIYRTCVEHYRDLVVEAKNSLPLQVQYVECALGTGDHNLAREEVNKMLKKDPQNTQAMYLMAKSLYHMGGEEAAKKHLRRCAQVNQDFRPCVDFAKKIKQYGKVMETMENMKKMNKWQLVVESVGDAFKVDPEPWNYSDLLKTQCEAYLKLRKIHEGLQACGQLIDYDEGSPALLDVYLTRSELHILQDDLDAAQRDIQKAREIDGNNRTVQEKQANLDRLRKMADRKDYYKILGVPKTADEKAIKSSYRKLAMKLHPDKTKNLSEEEQKKAETQFRDVNEAKEVLLDEEKRGKYDRGEDLNPQQQGGGFQQGGFPGGFPFGGGGGHFKFNFG